MDKPGENTARDDEATRGRPAAGRANGAAATPAAGPTARPAAGAGGRPADEIPDEFDEDAEHDSTWIYDQLGLSAEAYKGEPMPDAASLPSSAEFARRSAVDLDYDAVRREAEGGESPFPPGSLGGGIVDPPPRKFDGFPPPGSGLPSPARPGASEPAATDAGTAADTSDTSDASATSDASDAPTAATAEGAGGAESVAEAGQATPERASEALPTIHTPREDDPFRLYDERQRTGDLSLPTHNPTPRAAVSGVPRAPRSGAIIPAESERRLSADSLTAANVLKARKTPPGRGWRKSVLDATGGVINLGPSVKELRIADFEARVRTPIQGCHRLAVISLKGGVGKTTTAAALGSMFASLRGDRVIAVDANPDRGTLGDKIVAGGTTATVRDFVGRSNRLDKYSAVREFTAQASSRLEVLASESDPLASMAFSEQDYRVITEVLERFYNLILTDCGTGLLHSAMVGVLAKAEQVVIVSSASLDGAKSASATLDWLEAHQYTELARESVTVVTSVRPQANTVQLDEIMGHFAKRTRAVVAVPYDAHLAEGGQIDLDRLSKGAYHAYLELAADVGDAFARIPGYR